MPTSDAYTPSTDEVRADYVRDHTRNFDSYMTGRSLTSEQEVYGARYDRMIESVRAEERERIAQAIIERTSGYYSMSGPPEDRSQYYLGINHAARIAREGA